jgi:hypothetical protein
VIILDFKDSFLNTVALSSTAKGGLVHTVSRLHSVLKCVGSGWCLTNSESLPLCRGPFIRVCMVAGVQELSWDLAGLNYI